MSNNGLWCGERCREAQICGICCFHGCGNSYHDLYSKLLTSASSQNSWKSNGGCHHDRRRVSLPWKIFEFWFLSLLFFWLAYHWCAIKICTIDMYPNILSCSLNRRCSLCSHGTYSWFKNKVTNSNWQIMVETIRFLDESWNSLSPQRKRKVVSSGGRG